MTADGSLLSCEALFGATGRGQALLPRRTSLALAGSSCLSHGVLALRTPGSQGVESAEVLRGPGCPLFQKLLSVPPLQGKVDAELPGCGLDVVGAPWGLVHNLPPSGEVKMNCWHWPRRRCSTPLQPFWEARYLSPLLIFGAGPGKDQASQRVLAHCSQAV